MLRLRLSVRMGRRSQQPSDERGVYFDRAIGLVRAVSSAGKTLSLVFALNGDLDAAIADAFGLLEREDPIRHGASPPPLPNHLRLI